MNQENCDHPLRGRSNPFENYECKICGKVLDEDETAQQSLQEVNPSSD